MSILIRLSKKKKIFVLDICKAPGIFFFNNHLRFGEIKIEMSVIVKNENSGVGI